MCSPGVLGFYWDLDSDHVKGMGRANIKDVGKKAACFLGATQPSLRENWMSGKHRVSFGTINRIGGGAF